MTNQLLHLESRALGFLKKQILGRSVAVSFSGGKDSLVVLDLARRLGIRKAVFCDTTIEFDETIEYVKTVSRIMGIKIEIVRPPRDFFSIVLDITMPSRIQRWCCEVLKFGPLARWAKENEITSFVTGLRRDESFGRDGYSKIDKNPYIDKVVQLNPILEWSDEEVWAYIESYDLPVNPLYKIFPRIGCWCCPFKSEKQWNLLQEHFPEKVSKLEKVLRTIANREHLDTHRFIEEGGWKHWIHLTRKVAVGKLEIRDSGSTAIVEGCEEEFPRLAALLPALTNDFHIEGKQLRINLNGERIQRLHILIEKALNCVGCEACLSLCPSNSLYLDEHNRIAVDKDTCSQCQKCLSTTQLKGSCVARHYSPKKHSLITIEQERPSFLLKQQGTQDDSAQEVSPT